MTRVHTTAQHSVEFAYEIGEEVVARLESVDARTLDVPPVHRAPLPAWTIGAIIARRSHPADAYLLAFRHEDARWIAWVSEGAIEGIA